MNSLCRQVELLISLFLATSFPVTSPCFTYIRLRIQAMHCKLFLTTCLVDPRPMFMWSGSTRLKGFVSLSPEVTYILVCIMYKFSLYIYNVLSDGVLQINIAFRIYCRCVQSVIFKYKINRVKCRSFRLCNTLHVGPQIHVYTYVPWYYQIRCSYLDWLVQF